MGEYWDICCKVLLCLLSFSLSGCGVCFNPFNYMPIDSIIVLCRLLLSLGANHCFQILVGL